MENNIEIVCGPNAGSEETLGYDANIHKVSPTAVTAILNYALFIYKAQLEQQISSPPGPGSGQPRGWAGL